MEDTKKKRRLLILTVAFLLTIVFGAAYAYIQAQIGSGASSNLLVNAATVDSLSFHAGEPIKIDANLENFGEGAGNLKGSTTATATLLANNTTNKANAEYNVYFIVEENDFVYSTEDKKPELLLKITDPNGNEVTDIEGLLYTENGFDITEATGSFLIVEQYDIVANPKTVQTWNVEVTLVNLDTDQKLNEAKKLSSVVNITTETKDVNKLPLIAEKVNADTSEIDTGMVNQNINYQDSLVTLSNPDRGWYRAVTLELEDNSVDMRAQCMEAKNQNISIIHLRIGLGKLSGNANSDKVDKDFTAAQLQYLNDLINLIKDDDLKVILRFAYDFDGNSGKEPKSFETIKNHIRQLSSFFNANKNVISTLEAGFLGPWGEMHTAGVYQTDDYYKTLIETLLENTPSEMIINIRKPYFYKLVVGSLNNSQHRLGIYNDGYFGSETDLGTFHDEITRDSFIKWMKVQGKYTLYGGEATLSGEAKDEVYSDADFVLAEMPKTHTSYLNSQFNLNVIDKWKDQYYRSSGAEYDGQTAYKYITDHLGYRIVLRNSLVSSSVEKGAICGVNLELDNVGFGNIVKPQKTSIILRKDSDYYETTLNIVANNLKGGETQEVKFYFYIPSDIETGEWQIYLKMANANEPSYAVQFANPDIWDTDLLANHIGKVTVSGSVAANGIKFKQAFSSTAVEGDKDIIAVRKLPVKINYHIEGGETYYAVGNYNIELGTKIDFKDESVLASLGITLPEGYTFSYAQCYTITNDWDAHDYITLPTETSENMYEMQVYIKQITNTIPVKINYHIENGATYYAVQDFNIELGTKIDFKDASVVASLGITIPEGYTFSYAQCYAITNDWNGHDYITLPTETSESMYEIQVYIKK